jgi:predicted nucleotidyltransferase
MESAEEDVPESPAERMKTLLMHARVNKKILLERLKLKENEVLNIYLIGSYLWGCATWSSDFDVIIVHSNWKQSHSVIHNGEIDASILSEEVCGPGSCLKSTTTQHQLVTRTNHRYL